MKLAIYCSGDAGRDVLTLVNEIERWDEVFFVDDVVDQKEVCGLKVIKFTDIREDDKDVEFVIANGEPAHRKMLYEKVSEKGYSIATIVSPRALIEDGAEIGAGSVVYESATIATNVKIGKNTSIGVRSFVGHNGMVGDNCIVGSLAFISGGCRIEDSAYVAPGAMVRDRIHIGRSAIISMGAVILRNVKDRAIMVGNPAKRIGENQNDRVFNMFGSE